MFSVVIQVVCWLCLGATALGATAIFSVGRFYNPQHDGPLMFLAVAAPLLIAVLLVLGHRVRKGPLHHLLAIFDGGLGLLLAGVGLFSLIRDPGDLILYIWPLLLGIGLLYLGFESKLGAST